LKEKNRPKTGLLPLKTGKNRAKPITKRLIKMLNKLPELKNILSKNKKIKKIKKGANQVRDWAPPLSFFF
jgi:hypothetical protein